MEIDTDGSGIVDLDEFFSYLSVEKTQFGTQLFNLIGETKNAPSRTAFANVSAAWLYYDCHLQLTRGRFADENQSGEIDFNEFLVGLWNVTTPTPASGRMCGIDLTHYLTLIYTMVGWQMCTFDEEALLKFAFQLIDKDGSGYVDKEEVFPPLDDTPPPIGGVGGVSEIYGDHLFGTHP